MNQPQHQVHAPYHFVPLSKWTYMPQWAHLVSHDHPFEQGISGVINYQLVNHSPLCVGNEQQKNPGEPNHILWAKNPLNTPIIPGSSLKGMIRSVLEIGSFSKFSAIDDSRFSYRDISNTETTYAKEIHDTKAQAYWLKFDVDSGQWLFRKTNHTSLFHDTFNKFANTNIENIAFKQPTVKKYQQYPLSQQQGFNFDIVERRMKGTKGKEVAVSCAENLSNDNGGKRKTGYAVFSGFRPGKREYTTGRLNFSYCFYDESHTLESKEQSDLLVQRLFENHDEALVEELKNNSHPTLGIPIFARENQRGKIIALGFAKMPRKLYDCSVHDLAIKQQQLSQSDSLFDMAELMFGTLRDKGFGLKSRISFSDASCTKNNGIKRSSAVILGQPKASYLSAYLEQRGGKTNTVHNELSQYGSDSQLKGWKRYPSKASFNSHLPSDLASKTEVQSTLELMAKNSQFNGKIVFHNLLPEELGGLLWALQLKSEYGRCYHNLGHGKPLGAGAVIFDNISLTGYSNDASIAELPTVDELVQRFTDNMNQSYPANSESTWQQSTQIQHLLAFAEADDNDGKPLHYMELSTQRGGEYTSYSSSVSGRDKQTLPNWQHHDQILSRSESIHDSQPSNFGRGRLSELLPSEENRTLSEQKLISNIEQAQLAENMAAMSDAAQLYYKIQTGLDNAVNKEQRQNFNSDIKQLIEELLALPCDEGFIEAFYSLCKNTEKSAYLDLARNKRNKEELAKRKAALQALAAQYQLGQQ